ncbi:MAG: dethiobiotin synthase [Polyangiaceae bacterium]|nr:dethiobiotin synthase [Polyangiaceae bacterium]
MRVVVVGTGTGIGKTHLGVALVAAAVRAGLRACGLKPIESGVPAGAVGEDSAALAAVSNAPIHFPPPYTLVDPVSPHLAARRAGVSLRVEAACEWVDCHAADFVLVETAGALMSPLGVGLTNRDLATALHADRWVLVAPDRLGVLHDVAASNECSSGRHPTSSQLVVMQAPETKDASTGTNADELMTLGIAKRVLSMPRGHVDDEACRAAADRILAALMGGDPAE